MDEKVKLGFVGAGFVGGAMIRGFSQYNPIKVYDRGKNIGSLLEVVEFSDVIFVAVPTPMRKDGSCDTRIVEEILRDINQAVAHNYREDDEVEVVLRSTVPPNFLLEMHAELDNINLIFMPEFLTERTADLDFINAPRFVVGLEDGETSAQHLCQALTARFPGTPIKIMSLEEASMVKYATNNFFTVKLSFFNEIYNQCLEVGADPDRVIAEVLQDGRIGRSHFQVPGHDGDLGWGGHCFPKDNRAYSTFAKDSSTMADAAWEVNERFRSKKDWEEQRGRAVSED